MPRSRFLRPWSLVLLVVAAIAAALVAATPAAAEEVTQTRFGPLSEADKTFLVKVRQAGAWEGPVGRQAQQLAASERVKDVGRNLAADHANLDEEVTTIAAQFGMTVPTSPSPEQQGWINELQGKRGTDYDVTFAQRLRAAHGGVFAVIANIRANTRNELIRLFAERTNVVVNKHMKLLEGTGMVNYEALPQPAIPGSTPALKNASASQPAERSYDRLVIGALLAVTALLAFASIRRVIAGS